MQLLERTTNGGVNSTRPLLLFASGVVFSAATLTSAQSAPEPASLFHPSAARTTAGYVRKDDGEDEQGDGISELRRLSGLTWEQVAALFGVSRRAVHHWASGKPMAADHQAHLQRIVGHLRNLHVGRAQPAPSAMFSPIGPKGEAIFDLLAKRDYQRLVELTGGPDSGAPYRSQVEVAPERAPTLQPGQLVSFIEDEINIKTEPRRRVKAVRTKRT